jgi:hypothetical protein
MCVVNIRSREVDGEGGRGHQCSHVNEPSSNLLIYDAVFRDIIYIIKGGVPNQGVLMLGILKPL